MLLSIFLITLLLVQVNAHTHNELSEQYSYNVQLDNEGRYTMFYSYDTNLSILRIAVLVNTTGWIGLGISPNGQMPGSDVVIGWVDSSGEAFLQDRYAFARTTPRLDASQDWDLTGANEEGGFTTLQFERKLDTCDDGDDLPISFGDTTHLIFSYHTEDPVGNEQLSRHQFQGTMRIDLFGQAQNVRNISSDVQYIDVTNVNAQVPAEDTTYFCTLLEIPKVIQDKTHYIIKYTTRITPESAQHVHHMLLYLCEGMNLTGHPDVGVNRECNNISEEVQPCRSSTIISSWAYGGSEFIFPEGVGLPIGGEDEIHTHYLLEMHYDNPEELGGIVDSSGFRIFYTDKPQERDAGVFIVGQTVNSLMIIPPGVEKYTVTGFCSGNCTETFIPPEGITIFANLLHTHTIGAALKLRHIRDGVELDPIDVNLNYDFNYQQINFIPSVTILPGDDMILECVYNSKNRRITTFGGESTSDEMCLSVLFYYPAIPLEYCFSQAHPSAYDQWLNTYVPSDQHFAINAAADNNITGTRPVFDSLDWSEDNYRMFEETGQTGKHIHICLSGTQQDLGFIEVKYPVFVERPLNQSERNCQPLDLDRSGSTMLYSSVITMVLCWMIAAII